MGVGRAAERQIRDITPQTDNSIFMLLKIKRTIPQSNSLSQIKANKQEKMKEENPFSEKNPSKSVIPSKALCDEALHS